MAPACTRGIHAVHGRLNSSSRSLNRATVWGRNLHHTSDGLDQAKHQSQLDYEDSGPDCPPLRRIPFILPELFEIPRLLLADMPHGV